MDQPCAQLLLRPSDDAVSSHLITSWLSGQQQESDMTNITSIFLSSANRQQPGTNKGGNSTAESFPVLHLSLAAGAAQEDMQRTCDMLQSRNGHGALLIPIYSIFIYFIYIYINRQKGLIYLSWSVPVETQMSEVLCNITCVIFSYKRIVTVFTAEHD